MLKTFVQIVSETDAVIPGDQPADDQQRLVKDLFQGYNKLIRPGNNGEKTVVTFAINLAVIIFVVSTGNAS